MRLIGAAKYRYKGSISRPSRHVVLSRLACKRCGSPLDIFHDGGPCHRDYQAQLDREAMARKKGLA